MKVSNRDSSPATASMPTLPAVSAHGRKHCIVPMWGALIGTAGHLRGGPGHQTAEVSPCDAVPSGAKGSWDLQRWD